MAGQPVRWEDSLLAKARVALEQHVWHRSEAVQESLDLQAAYRHCEAVTRRNSRTFYTATALMPREKRLAVRVLYAFCRVSDDIVDAQTPVAERQAKLAQWRLAIHQDPPAHDPVLAAWHVVRHRYHIPVPYMDHLLDALAQDLSVSRYARFDQLAEYCYGVASTVGLMSMHITGFNGPEALPYAIKLGVALQLTNILRDVGEDWRQGRVYLPQEELAAYGLDEEDIAAGRVDHRWRAFMRFQIERARRLYAESLPGVALLHRDGRFAVAAAAELYRAILDDIEAHGYDVFSRRAHISDARKLARLPGIAWRSYTNRYARLLERPSP